MGAYALVRQAFYDAGWYGQAWDAYTTNKDLPRPERSDALAALRGYLGGKHPVVIDAGDEIYFLRADRIGKEFGLDVIVRGSGDEYRRLSDIVATKRAVIVPLDFPKAPNVATPEAAANTSLERLMQWDMAPRTRPDWPRPASSSLSPREGLKMRAHCSAQFAKRWSVG